MKTAYIKSRQSKIPELRAIAWGGFKPLTAETPLLERQEPIHAAFGSNPEEAEQALKIEMEEQYGKLSWA